VVQGPQRSPTFTQGLVDGSVPNNSQFILLNSGSLYTGHVDWLYFVNIDKEPHSSEGLQLVNSMNWDVYAYSDNKLIFNLRSKTQIPFIDLDKLSASHLFALILF